MVVVVVCYNALHILKFKCMFLIKIHVYKVKKAIRDRMRIITIRMVNSLSNVITYTLYGYTTSRLVYSMSQWILHTNTQNCTHELQIGLIYMLLACRWEQKNENQPKNQRGEEKKSKNEESKREMLDLGNEKNHTAVNKWHFSASKWASCANN